MKNTLFLLLLTFFSSAILSGQNDSIPTVGLVYYSDVAAEGYTLLAPQSHENIYLIDNCGYKVHEWETLGIPGVETKLLEDGHLLRAEKVPMSGFNAGGSGGRLSIYDWDSNLLWTYVYSEANNYHQHHDVQMLPNGNILLLAWEYHSKEEAMARGRFPSLVTDAGIWSERVVEIQPIGTDSAAVVWEWRLWDHLVQDFDDSLLNFGEILDNFQKVDINASDNAGNVSHPDWIHANGIDYNEELDQIIISSKHLSEFWIIDHSITTAEAAGEQGDLLFRFGNPIITQTDHLADQVLSHQHNAHWIPDHLPYGGHIMVFNNGRNEEFSEVYIFDSFLVSGNYDWDSYPNMGADKILWKYPSIEEENPLYSTHLSGANVLENGNILICHGSQGVIREVDEENHTVWEYINPIVGSTITTQGNTPEAGELFRAYRYPVDYPGFSNIVLEATERIELEPYEDDCQEAIGLNTQVDDTLPLRVYKTSGQLQLEGKSGQYNIILYNQVGLPLGNWTVDALPTAIDMQSIPVGLYFVNVQNRKNKQIKTYKIIETD